MMATTSKPLALDLTDSTASLDAIWDSVVEKMNSAPGTPRVEATEILAEVEPKAALPPIQAQETEKDAPVPVKPTISLRPKSPVEEGGVTAQSTLKPHIKTPKEEGQKNGEGSPIQTMESRAGTSHGEANDVEAPKAQITDPQSKNLGEEVRKAEKLPTQVSDALLNGAKEERKDDKTPIPVDTKAETTKDMRDSKFGVPEQETKVAEAIGDASEEPATTTLQLNGLKEGKGEGQAALKSQTAAASPGNLKMDVKEHLAVPVNPEAIPLPNSPIDGRESVEPKDFGQPEKLDTTQTPVGSKDEKDSEDKKSLQIFTKLKRKLSTNNVREKKKEDSVPPPQPPLPVLNTAQSPITPVEGSQHVELVKSKTKTPPTSAKEGKKSNVLFKSIRAAMKFSSGKASAKSPTSSKPAQSPLHSPVSPQKPKKPFEKTVEITPSPGQIKSESKTSERPAEKPAPKVTAKPAAKVAPKPAERKQPEKSLPRAQPSVRRPGHNAAAIKPPLRPRQTWSPASSNPILASNPSAKLYTIWPRYPVIEAQTDEVQAVLEGFLLNEKAAIEKSCASGSLVNFWKVPLTTDQAAVIQGNKFVSSIQLSKLDYDPSDYFC